MPARDKSAYTDKQQRKADHVAEGQEKRGVFKKDAERGAWAVVDNSDGGGKKSESGRGKSTGQRPRTRAIARVARPLRPDLAQAVPQQTTRRRKANER